MKPTPSWTLREADEGDLDAILDLRKRVFSVEDPEKQDPAFWKWEFVAGPEGRARIFVAVDGKEIVGHYAMIPQDFMLGAVARNGSIVVDLMTHPDYRRQGIFNKIAKFAFSAASDQVQFASAYPIRKESMAGFLSIGWIEHFKIPVLVRPLSWPAIARRFRIPLGPLFGLGALPWRWIRSLFATSLGDGEVVRDLDASECELLASVAGQGVPAGAAYRVRTAEFYRWRLFASPRWKYRVTGLFKAGELRAFVASRQARLLGTDSLAIVDMAALPDADRELSLLLHHAIAGGSASGQAVAGAMLTRGNRYYRALRRAGFYPGPHSFSLILYSETDGFHGSVPAPNNWLLSWADTDGV